MKLSIITINFNNRVGLLKTIESVVSQTSTDFEYIIIDGGSTDGSKELIQENASHVTHWISEKDEGIYHAMNKGILLAKGEYCQFLNSGDYLVSNHVIESLLMDVKGQSFIYGNMIKVWPNGKKFKNTSIKHASFYTFFTGSLNHSPCLIKRSLFDKYGLYDQSFRIVSDWKFFLEAIALGNESVQYVDLDITYFDMTGISNTQTELDKEERKQVLTKTLPLSIYNDYAEYWRAIDMMKRLKKNKFIFGFVWLMERVLFKLEKTFKSSN